MYIYIYIYIYIVVLHGYSILFSHLFICQVSSIRANKALAPWCSDIVRHFWHCAETAGGSAERFKIIVSKRYYILVFTVILLIMIFINMFH